MSRNIPFVKVLILCAIGAGLLSQSSPGNWHLPRGNFAGTKPANSHVFGMRLDPRAVDDIEDRRGEHGGLARDLGSPDLRRGPLSDSWSRLDGFGPVVPMPPGHLWFRDCRVDERTHLITCEPWRAYEGRR